ncbi:integrase core domain-containing protein [Amycolatopsis sp. NPDC059021]|uniref:integrase core domain-containing protein n=1 Tax=Amycolatopsis sp. NPDC059021 TaxID=3346704 RepID=UPI00366AE891
MASKRPHLHWSYYDNTVAESFFATLKTEIVAQAWATRDDPRRAVFAYLSHYNHDRLYSILGYRTPTKPVVRDGVIRFNNEDFSVDALRGVLQRRARHRFGRDRGRWSGGRLPMPQTREWRQSSRFFQLLRTLHVSPASVMGRP